MTGAEVITLAAGLVVLVISCISGSSPLLCNVVVVAELSFRLMLPGRLNA